MYKMDDVRNTCTTVQRMLMYVLFIHEQTHNLPGNSGRCPGHGGSYVAPSVVAEKNATRSRLDTHASWSVARHDVFQCTHSWHLLSRIDPIHTVMHERKHLFYRSNFFLCCHNLYVQQLLVDTSVNKLFRSDSNGGNLSYVSRVYFQ